MSERVMMYTSYPLTFDEVSIAVLAAGGEPVVPIDDEYDLLGRVVDGKRHVLLSGSRHPQDPSRFWEEKLSYIGKELLEEIEARLGGKPVASFLLGIGYAYSSGLLAVELAYQCAVRWPCIVWGEVLEEGEIVVKVYTREDMERLRKEGKTFTGHGMVDDDEDEESCTGEEGERDEG